MRNLKTLAVVAAMLSVVGSASAQIMTSSAAFQAAIANDPGQFNNPLGSSTANWNGGTPNMAYTVTATPIAGLYSDGNFIGVNNNGSDLLITFTSGNVRAVGGNWFHTDFSDNFRPQGVTLTYNDGTVDTYTPGSASDFHGYVSASPILWVKMSKNSPYIDSTGTSIAVWASLDNLVTSSHGAVPEPGSLLALGLGAVAMMRRKRN
ncbi:MAG: PEP-CTERM sorting domain-containing protein [Armatimonadetes bacterium]|nr:PEP-CTERM sorting domain-containing protein [Armatimonadota bacterium]